METTTYTAAAEILGVPVERFGAPQAWRWSEKYLNGLRTMRSAVVAAQHPAYDAAIKLVEAERALAADEDKPLREAGFARRNDYAGQCASTGVRVEPGKGWARRVRGRWLVYSDAAARELAAGGSEKLTCNALGKIVT